MGKYSYFVTYSYYQGSYLCMGTTWAELDQPLEYFSDVKKLEKEIGLTGSDRVVSWKEIQGKDRPLTR